MSYTNVRVTLNNVQISDRVEKINFSGVNVAESSPNIVDVTLNQLQNNFNATTDPVATDDSNAGYSVGSTWINTTTDKVFTLADDTAGAAIWVDSSLTAADLATVAVTGSYTDLINAPFIFDEVTDGTNSTTQVAGSILTLAAGTDMDVTVNPSTNTVTFDWIGTFPPDQNLFQTVALAGNTVGDTTIVADTTTDTLTLIAGTNITLTGNAAGDQITISANASGSNQNLFETVQADDLTTLTADNATDLLPIKGGPGIETTVLGGELVINGRTTVGTVNEIDVATVGTTNTVGLADNPVLPGTGSTQLPQGTTAERPVSPADGAVRYNTDLDCIEIYSLATTTWACLTKEGDLVGSSFTLMFSGDGTLRNSWLDHGGNNIPTSTTFAVVPFDCVLSAITYTNSKVGSNVQMEIYSALENTATQVLKLTWPILGRSGRRADFGQIAFSAGEKIGIYARDTGNTPNDAIVNCFFQVTATNTGTNIDDNAVVFTV